MIMTMIMTVIIIIIIVITIISITTNKSIHYKKWRQFS